MSKSLDNLTMYKKNYTPQPCEIHASMWGRFDIQKSVNTICHNSKLKLKNHTIISINTDKVFGKIQYPLMIKTLSKLEIERNFLNLIKNIYL